MIAFLTSHIGGSYKAEGKRLPACLNPENKLVEKLKERWPENARVLIISADPESHERNDSILYCLSRAFPMSGLEIGNMIICDSRNDSTVASLSDYSVIILSGGHVPTQNRYFEKLELKEKLTHFDGILIGISAGTMNCADTVYAHPELEGEAIDPAYQRFLPGLGITEVMVLPHYQMIKDDVLDGLRIFEDIAYPDSHGREFYALCDGSYLLIENGTTTLYGEAWLIKDGAISKFCSADERRIIK